MRADEAWAIGQLGRLTLRGSTTRVAELHRGIAERAFGAVGPSVAPVKGVHDAVAGLAYGGGGLGVGARARGGGGPAALGGWAPGRGWSAASLRWVPRAGTWTTTLPVGWPWPCSTARTATRSRRSRRRWRPGWPSAWTAVPCRWSSRRCARRSPTRATGSPSSCTG